MSRVIHFAGRCAAQGARSGQVLQGLAGVITALAAIATAVGEIHKAVAKPTVPDPAALPTVNPTDNEQPAP